MMSITEEVTKEKAKETIAIIIQTVATTERRVMETLDKLILEQGLREKLSVMLDFIYENNSTWLLGWGSYDDTNYLLTSIATEYERLQPKPI